MSSDWEAEVRNADRISALHESGLVGMDRDDAFDRLIELASELTGVSRGCITLVDAEHSSAMSTIGFPEGPSLVAPIEEAFCRYVVGSGRPLIVEDARNDPRTVGDPAIHAFDAVAWIGYGIEDADGVILGTFCLMDSSPREWTPTDIQLVATLAKAASTEIALR
ncbi:MAG: GAF domain-containing protein, partial [Acidimicrobiales bacterium]